MTSRLTSLKLFIIFIAILKAMRTYTTPEFEDHELNRRMSGYNEFHLRDTPKNKTPSETNDVLVAYTLDTDELVLIGIRVESHDRLFPGQNRSKRYRKNDE